MLLLEQIRLPPSVSGDGRNLISALNSYFSNIVTYINANVQVTGEWQVENLQAVEQTGNKILVTWTAPVMEGYNHAEVHVSIDDGGFTLLGVHASQFLIENVIEQKNYKIKVVAVNDLGVKSNFLNAPAISCTIVSQEIYPVIITNTGVSFSNQGGLLQWDKIVDTDFSCFEIRANSVVLTTTTDNFTRVFPTSRVGDIYIYAKSISGKYSQPAIVSYNKAFPDKPDYVTVSKETNGVSIYFPIIPDNCIGAMIYINGSQITVAKNTYLYTSSTEINTVQVSYLDQFSEGIRSDIVYVHPPSVQSLTLTISDLDRSLIKMTWLGSMDTNFSHFEVREGGSDWVSATPIQTNLKTNSYEYRVTVSGYKVFRVKEVNLMGYYSPSETNKGIQVTLQPDAPLDFVVAQSSRDRSTLFLSWSASPGHDIAGYELAYGNTFESSTPIIFTKELAHTFILDTGGSVSFFIRAKTIAGWYSAVSTYSFAPIVLPDDVTGFTIVQSPDIKSKITLSWTKPGIDVAYMEIRKGSTWDLGTLIGQRVTATSFEYTVSQEELITFWIKAVSYSGKYSQNAIKAEYIPSLNPTPPTNMVITQDPTDKSNVHISFTPSTDDDITMYQIRTGLDWEHSELVQFTPNPFVNYKVARTETYQFLIKAQNTAGYLSEALTKTISIVVEPANVTNFVAYQDGEFVEMFWEKSSEDTNIAYFEVRQGSSWETSSLIVTGLTTPEYSIKVDTETTYHYQVKAISNGGVYSVSPAHASVTVTNLTPKNIIVSFDEIALKTGTHTNTEFGTSQINFSNFPGRFSDYPTTRFSETGGSSVLRLQKQVSGQYFPTGEYLVVRKDVGSLLTANISTLLYSTSLLTQGVNAQLQYRTSRDGNIFTNWVEFVPTQATFRYIDFKVLLVTSDTTKTPEVGTFVINIDVPDVDRYGSCSVAIGGTTINYGYKYYSLPVVSPSAIGIDKRAEVMSKTTETVTIRVIDKNGNDVGGQVDWLARGH